MIIIKTEQEIETMRQGGRILAKVLKKVCSLVRPGIATIELDRTAEKLIAQYGGQPAFKGYRGFPATICVSINDEVVHGIPKVDRFIEGGDIVSLDIGLIYQNYYTDMACSLAVGQISEVAKQLLAVTETALHKGIEKAQAGNNLGEIGYAIQQYAEKFGFSIVRDLVGHGVGIELHEDPKIPNYGNPKQGPILEEGMTLAIEPMVNVGTPDITFDDDGWTARTADKKLSAHFEHTIAITAQGPKILTKSLF